MVDDGSTDGSLQQLEDVDDPRLTIVSQQNRGLAGARNTGILLARGKYIGLLDSDDVWYPRKAERQLAVMEADPAIGLTFSHSAYLREDGSLSGQLLISRCKQPTAMELVRRNHIGNGSSPILRSECFKDAGLFAEDLRSCEDYEMWVRVAALTQWRIQLVPEVLTGYRVRSGSLSTLSSLFTNQARYALEHIKEYMPELSSRDIARCYAENLRIASRKALSNGDMKVSRALMADALRECPWLAIVDIRALGLLLIHVISLLLPSRYDMSIYRIARSMMRGFYFLFDANAKLSEAGGGGR